VVEVRNLGGSGDPFRAGQVTGTPSAVAVSARRGLVLGAGSQRFGFTLWDIADGDVLADVSSGDVLGIVYAASFDESGDRLVVSDGSTGDLLVWSVDALVNGTDERPVRLPGGDRAVLSLAVAGDRVVAVDEGGVVRQFSLSSGRPTGTPMRALAPLGEPPATMIAAGHRDGDQRIVAVRADGVVEWDGLGRSGLNQARTDIEGLAVVAAAPAGDQTFAIGADGALHTLDGDGAVMATVDAGVTEPSSAVALGPDRVAVGGNGLAVVDARTGAPLAERTDLEIVALAPAGGSEAAQLAAATSDGGVVLLDATDLSTVAGPVQATSDPITDLTVSPDGSTIVVGTTGGRTRDVVTVEVESAEVRTLEGHGAEVSGVAFSPDGSMLATGSDDRSIILWTTADWSPAAVLAGHEDRVRQLAFTADGSMLLSVSDDGTMRWWDVGEGAPIGLPLRSDGSRLLDVQTAAHTAVTHDGTTVSIWLTEPTEWVRIACEISSRPLTDVEREAFLDGAEARCPS